MNGMTAEKSITSSHGNDGLRRRVTVDDMRQHIERVAEGAVRNNEFHFVAARVVITDIGRILERRSIGHGSGEMPLPTRWVAGAVMEEVNARAGFIAKD